MRIPNHFRRRLLHWANENHCRARPFDFGIGPHDDYYLLRWYVVRKGRRWARLSVRERDALLDERDSESGGGVNVYIHRFLRSDDDRALHDHPWPWATLLLDGQYLEHLPASPDEPAGPTRVEHRQPGDLVCRLNAERPHRIELIDGQPATTLFITGRRRREWGFWCGHGWRHWRMFTDPKDSGQKGRGCD